MEPEVVVDQERVAEVYAHALGLSVDAGKEHLEFRYRALAAFDELRTALGDRCGELWFRDGRLNVGVSDSDYPPGGVEVDAAKAVLERHGLLERSDVVPAARGTPAMVAAMARVSAMIEGSGFARVSLRSPGQSPGQSVGRKGLAKRLVIETDQGLTDWQQTLVDAAVAVAGVPVQVAACLGPGSRFAPTPLRETDWRVLSVSEDGRSLRLNYHWESHPPHQVSLFLQETEAEIHITIAIPDLDRPPGGGPILRMDIAGSRPLTVHLAGPINGRRIVGPGQKMVHKPLGHLDQGFMHEPTRLPDGTYRGHVPNVVGLAPTDALSVLHSHGFQPRTQGNGRQVAHQEPVASTLRDENDRTIDITLGP